MCAASWHRNAHYAFTGKGGVFDDPRRFPPEQAHAKAQQAALERQIAICVLGSDVQSDSMDSLKFVLKKSKDDGQTLNLKWFDEKNYRGVSGSYDVALLVMSDRTRKDFSASPNDYPFLDFLARLAGEDSVFIVIPAMSDSDAPACMAALAQDATMDSKPRLRRAFEGGRCLVWGRKQGQEKITEAVGRLRRGLYVKAAPPPPPPPPRPAPGPGAGSAKRPPEEPYYGETGAVSYIGGP